MDTRTPVIEFLVLWCGFETDNYVIHFFFRHKMFKVSTEQTQQSFGSKYIEFGYGFWIFAEFGSESGSRSGSGLMLINFERQILKIILDKNQFSLNIILFELESLNLHIFKFIRYYKFTRLDPDPHKSWGRIQLGSGSTTLLLSLKQPPGHMCV